MHFLLLQFIPVTESNLKKLKFTPFERIRTLTFRIIRVKFILYNITEMNRLWCLAEMMDL